MRTFFWPVMLIPSMYTPGWSTTVLLPFPEILVLFRLWIVMVLGSGAGRSASGSGIGGEFGTIGPEKEPPPGVDQPGLPPTRKESAVRLPPPLLIMAEESVEFT